MKKENLFWSCILVNCLNWSASTGVAQTPQDSIRLLTEVVITATRFPKSQRETGKVMVVVDSALIQRSEGKNLAQLLNEQAGLEINGANSSPGKDKSVYLRGATGQYTLILIDGVPLTDASGVGGAFDLRLISLDQIERIEILKGSQSTLYGSDAIAGVIHILTKHKEDKPFGGQASVRYGSYHSLNSSLAVGGSSGSWNYHAGYSHDRSEGISEAKELNGNNLFDQDGYGQNSFHANFTGKPMDALSIKGLVRYADFKGRFDGGAFTDDVTAEFQSSLLDFGLHGEYNLNKGMVQGKYLNSATQREFQNSFGRYQYKGKANTLDLFYHRKLNNQIHFASGINFQNLQMQADQATIENPSTELYSIYGAGYLRELHGLSAEAGIRFNHHSEFGQAFTISINPSYRINKRIKLFINYSTGFKAPTLNELFGPFGANQDLEAQYSHHHEAGIRYDPEETGKTFRATVFNREIKNAIVYGNPGYVNLDRQSDHGFELEATSQIGKKISVQAYYTYVNGAVKTRTFDHRDTSFNNLIRRPKNTIGASLGYEISKKMFVSISLKSTGKRKDTFFDPNTFYTSPVNLSGYQLLNVYVGYRWGDKWKWYLDAKNVLNQQYEEVYGYNALRLNVCTGLGFKF